VKPINVVVLSGASSMLLGATTGLLGLLLHARPLGTMAVGFLVVGVGVSFVPLVAACSHGLYTWLRGRGR
jgi:hypothetical protein